MDKLPATARAARAACLASLVIGFSFISMAATAADAVGPTAADVAQVVGPAMAFLDAAQADDGSFSNEQGPGVTALVAAAMMRHGRSPSDPTVAKSLKYLEGFVHGNGGIFQEGSKHHTDQAVGDRQGQQGGTG
jgi:hypothetical protein